MLMQGTYITAANSCERGIDQDIVRRLEFRDRPVPEVDFVLGLKNEREVLRLWKLVERPPIWSSTLLPTYLRHIYAQKKDL